MIVFRGVIDDLAAEILETEGDMEKPFERLFDLRPLARTNKKEEKAAAAD